MKKTVKTYNDTTMVSLIMLMIQSLKIGKI